jgi:hypothetical protein
MRLAERLRRLQPVSIGLEGARMGMDADVTVRGGGINERNDLNAKTNASNTISTKYETRDTYLRLSKHPLPPYERCNRHHKVES